VARDLVLDVVARKNSKDLVTLADEFDRLAKETDEAGKKMHDTGTFSQFLAGELEKTKAKVKELGDEFNRTGKADVFASLRGAQRNQSVLEKLKKDLDAVLPSVQKQGIQAGDLFSEGFMSGLGKIGSAAAPVLVPTAIALASELLADIGGVVEGAAGFGSIFVGALVQLKTNPQVKAAAHSFASTIGDEFKGETDVFAQPLIDAFDELKADSVGPVRELGQAFAAVAPYVRDLAMYAGAAEEKFAHGFSDAVKKSGPVLEELGRDMTLVAGGFEQFFEQTSKGTTGEVEALDTLAKVIAGTIGYIGFLIRIGSDAYEMLVKFAQGVNFVVKNFTPLGALMQHALGLDLEKWLDGIAHSADGGGASMSGLAKKMDTTTGEIDRQRDAVNKLRNAYDDWFGKSMAVDEAQLTLLNDMANLTTATKGQKDAYNFATQAGRDHYEQLIRTIKAAKEYRDAQVASGVSAQQADAAYQQTYDSLVAQGKAAGLTAAQIAQLNSQFGQLEHTLNSLPNDVYVRTHFITTGTNPATFYHGLAHGGRADAPGYAYGGGVIKVGEQGPEYLSLPTGTGPMYVTPNSAINGAANRGGDGAMAVTVDFAGISSNMDQMVAAWLAGALRRGTVRLHVRPDGRVAAGDRYVSGATAIPGY
jgi:hypothetical protein